MSREENCEMGFNNGGTETDPFFGSGWDPIVSLAQAENFGGSGGSAMTDAHHEFSDPPLPHHHQLPHYPCFGNGSFSEMVTSFGLNADDYLAKRAISNENSQEDHQNFEEASPNGKRKRKGLDSHSPFNPNKKGEGDSKNKEKLEENNSRGKKQAREDGSNSGEAPPKENYVHVRAKRGQATNSHSLAERVRRERISERMRLLQELVPGCNKITGKAVMLDEIINYVQSLQQQVEFLSMKLATVNPELNIDIDRILSKDNINSRRVLGSNHGLSSSSNPYINGIRPGISFPTLPNTTPPFHSMPQGVWDSELQHLLQMGFDSNPAMGPNGRSKLEL